MIRQKNGKSWAILAIILVLLVLCMPTTLVFAQAHGGENEAGHGSTPWYKSSNLWKLINLSVLVLVLYTLLKVPLKQFFVDRREGIAQALQDAERARDEARHTLEEMRQRIEQAKDEIAAIIEKGREEASRESELIREESKKQIENMKRRVSDDLDQALIDVRQELLSFIATEAVSQARRKIEKLDRSALQARYVKNFHKTLRTQGGNSERS